ncbi:MAG: hypothetical protein ACLQLH_17040 [Terracidiphilus sp.]|jgi:hypothetical protein
MTETTQASSAPTTEANATPDPENPSLDHCIEAYMRAFKRAKRQGKDHSSALEIADRAFRTAIPLPSGSENTRNFVACVTYGMLLEAISGPAGARLLYAAQVASGIRTQPAPPKSTD